MPYAIPSNYYQSIMGAESSGNRYAKNPLSSASGLFQFTRPTWEGLGFDWTDRFDNATQWQAVQALTQQNAGYLNRLGLPITSQNLYAFHFLGSDDGSRVLTAPGSSLISSLVPGRVVNSNPFLKGMTVDGFKRWLTSKVSGSNSNGTGIGSNVSLGGNPIDIDPAKAAELAIALGTGNPFAIMDAGSDFLGMDSNPLEALLNWLKGLFSVETAIRFAFVIGGFVLIIVAIAAFAKVDKVIVSNVTKAVA